MGKIEGIEKLADEFEFDVIPNAKSVYEVTFDWEYSEDGPEDLLAICGNDVATIIMDSDKHLEAALKERGTPYHYIEHQIFVPFPSLRDASFLIEGFYLNKGVEHMSVFLMKECQPKLDKVQRKKKTEWHHEYHLQDDAVSLFLMDDLRVALVCAQDDANAKDFIEVLKKRMAGESAPLIETIEEATALEIPDELLADLKLPPASGFNHVTGQLLSDASIMKVSRARDEIDAIYDDELVQVITTEDLDDFFKKEKIPFQKQNGWLVSDAIPEAKRKVVLSKCHNEALTDETYLFYGSVPNVRYEKKQNQGFWSKLLTSYYYPVFELNEGGKCVVLVLDGQVAICFE
ncbi:hypothetical protein DUK53_11875 [Listeria sp. SHR_NRA_18]|uniref:hypothetical protein n=1 Tax=Listeria sp. SHR_NRA_18 TaxID=2269046 RepID=UPI00051DD80D|nr:hypothetical protein [Listeria sp. SHR_NRA_18]KGL39178.1 hypothetical protein EP56_14820 [Listeriaceae bacterium FSL A5-0209]RQW66398.1 hypothetical protein DUK53_11875 [Listeria sp. SHR_NRA_18]